ncbi:formyl transferase [Bradyrhizobium sp. USDA 336]|uniref:formyl transferase n=1 Tax=Bradyrhizobium sp. USDA 336 TaxID=3156311 RepID=UPI0038329165
MVAAQPEQKRIVILTRDGPEHRYVANMLCAGLSIDRIIVDRSTRRTRLRRAVRKGLVHFLGKATRAVFLKLIRDDEARTRSIESLLGQKAQAFYASDRIDYVEGINGAESLEVLRQRRPDAILIYGTSVVKNAVLDSASDMCVNLHTGISPQYRGTACSFWPVVNDELDMLGATIHECTSGVDSGPIFETVHSRYEPGDDLHTIFGRAVMVGAEAYVRVVQRYVAGTLSGVSQDLNLGREYRGADLTIGPELVARCRLARLRSIAETSIIGQNDRAVR